MSSVNVQLFELGMDPQWKDSENKMDELISGGANVNMMMLAASNRKDVDLVWKSFRAGACFLFAWQHTAQIGVDVHLYPHKISMIKVPGAVTKGTHEKTG